ncbi:hypothetical protein K2173_019224 [Erythroxylum novogranatense]|uniref:Protein kinase domain-containing protein n=1 Tax=Erythroxylum novogranatense TaxID=1862640 RepID=A0AAV8ST26_9ROSI|nr:hypothetical protein K2173_019224 [Erythroxylum novogranatense]
MMFQLPIPVSLVLCLAQVLAVSARFTEPECQEFCGYVAIPFPFGIGVGCYMNENFAVTCDNSFNPPKPFLNRTGMELLGVSMSGVVQVNNPVISASCNNSTSLSSPTGVDLSGSPFIYSSTYNRFTAMGCDNYARLRQNNDLLVGGCLSFCNGTQKNEGCYGLNCCQTTIPPYLKSYDAIMTNIIRQTTSCASNHTAFMVDKNWFDTSTSIDILPQMTKVPAVLEWGAVQGRCGSTETSSVFCSTDGYCWRQLSLSHLCICKGLNSNSNDNSDANSISYVRGSCEGADCINRKAADCSLYCVYRPENYSCSCPAEYKSYSINISSSSSKTSNRTVCLQRKIIDPPSRVNPIFIGCASGFGFLLLFGAAWWLYKAMKRRKTIKLKQMFFKRNGGMLLQQRLGSRDNNLEQTKLFSSKELEKATDKYNVNRIAGQGGQGTVYKGMTTDGKLVAIKKSKSVDKGKLQEFINEVVILSNINHRNVVKLLGCCLETEVPLLVYEFVPNGTLFQHLHDPNEEFPVTWELRLRIATEVAGAVSYLHSAASDPIYHRDIKSTNILLDEKFRAKVSDFGTSKSVAVDQTHVTTRVQGTFGYLDPEYFQSSQYTEKSDVYSFGVVLVELLTGQKPIRTGSSDEEEKSLIAYFLVSMEENRLSEILDTRVLQEGGKEEVIAVANLAKRCLNLNGKKRPTMKAVAMQLEAIRNSSSPALVQQEDEVVKYDFCETMGLTIWLPLGQSHASIGTSMWRMTSNRSCLTNERHIFQFFMHVFRGSTITSPLHPPLWKFLQQSLASRSC